MRTWIVLLRRERLLLLFVFSVLKPIQASIRLPRKILLKVVYTGKFSGRGNERGLLVVGVQSEKLLRIKTATGGKHCFALAARIRKGGE